MALGALSLESVFATVKVPPLLVDPTGGLLEPALAPINLVVAGVEGGVLSAMQEAILLLRGSMDEMGERLESLVAGLFGGLLGAESAALEAGRLLLEQAPGAANPLAGAEDALGRMEGLATAAVNEARRYAAEIRGALAAGAGGVEAAALRITEAARARVGALLSGRLRALTAELRGVCEGAAERAAAALRALEGAGERGGRELGGAISAAGADLRGAGAALRAAAREGGAALRAAKARLSEAADAAEARAAGGARAAEAAAGAAAGGAEAAASRLRGAAAAAGGLPSLGALLAAGVFLAVLWAALWAHYRLIAPHIRRSRPK